MNNVRSRKRDLISVERFGDMGFTDGYSGVKSRENSYITEYVKRKINSEEIVKRILAYNLGYKKGKIMANGVDKTQLKNNEISVNGVPITISDTDISDLYNNIHEIKLKNRTRR